MRLLIAKQASSHVQGCTQAFLPAVIVAFSKFVGVVWTVNTYQYQSSSADGKHLMCFQSGLISGLAWTETLSVFDIPTI